MNRHFITLVRSKEIVSGLAAIIKLEEEFTNYASSTGEDKDVFVFLQPEDVPLLKIAWMENHTELVRKPYITTKHPKGSRSKVTLIPDGEIFCASIEARTMKGKAQTLTKFLHHARDDA